MIPGLPVKPRPRRPWRLCKNCGQGFEKPAKYERECCGYSCAGKLRTARAKFLSEDFRVFTRRKS